MIGTIFGKVMWVGRATVFLVGLAMVLALTVGSVSAAVAGIGVGAQLNLGKTNTVNALSSLVGSVAGPSLNIDNNSANGSATALKLQVEPGQTPIKVNSGAKVKNLNADEVDGRGANGLVRVASFTGASPLQPGVDGAVATTRITTPASGFLVIAASSDFRNFLQNARPACFIQVDNSVAPARASIWHSTGSPTSTSKRIARQTRLSLLRQAGTPWTSKSAARTAPFTTIPRCRRSTSRSTGPALRHRPQRPPPPGTRLRRRFVRAF